MADHDSEPVPVDSLIDFDSAALGSRGGPDAAKVAGRMVDADIFGYGTHGVFRLRQ